MNCANYGRAVRLQLVVSIAALMAACGPAIDVPARSVREMTAGFPGEWRLRSPDAAATVEAGRDTLRIVATGQSVPVALERELDGGGFRGRQVTLTLEARAEGASPPTLAVAVKPGGYGDVVAEAALDGSWKTFEVHSVIPPDARVVTLSVALSGPAAVELRRVVLVDEAPEALPVASHAVGDLVALGRAMALIRYFHPSDEVAATDWNELAVVAVRHLLTRPGSLASRLTSVFGEVAPTVEFVDGKRNWTVREPWGPAAPGQHLTRWLHHGLGLVPSDLYRSFRTGDIGPGTEAPSIIVYRTVDAAALGQCSNVTLTAEVTNASAETDLQLWIRSEVIGGYEDVVTPAIPVSATGDGAITFDLPVPPGLTTLSVGVRLAGAGGAVVRSLRGTCRSSTVVDLMADGPPPSIGGQGPSYFTHELTRGEPCATRCLKLARLPFDTRPDVSRDLFEEDLGGGVRVRVPLALWTSGRAAERPTARRVVARAATDPASRIAALLHAWGAVRYFLPYLAGRERDWEQLLPAVVAGVVNARAAADGHVVLRQLGAHTRDGHTAVTHPAAALSHRLPFSVRRLDGRLHVWGVAKGFESVFKPGEELLEIDREPVAAAYAGIEKQVPASTPGWVEHATSNRLLFTHEGELHRVRLRDARGRVRDVIAPSVATDPASLLGTPREARPRTGTEVRPDVYYVDMHTVTRAEWDAVIEKVPPGGGLVFDHRGYITRTSFELLNQLARSPVSSSVWTVPVRPSPRDADVTFQSDRWFIRPSGRPVTARCVFLVDSRARSASETILEIVQAGRMGTIVGEPSAGINGDPTVVLLPAGFRLQFSGLKDIGPGGGTIQGRGVIPDVVVHPTLEGITAGRDEILDAALRLFDSP